MNLGPKINMFLLSWSDRQWSHLPVLKREIRRLLIKNAAPVNNSLDMINRTFASSAQTHARVLRQEWSQTHYWCWRSLTLMLVYSGRFMAEVLVEGLQNNPCSNPDLIVMSFIIPLLEYINCVVTRAEFKIRGRSTFLFFLLPHCSIIFIPHSIIKYEKQNSISFATVHNMSHLRSCSVLSLTGPVGSTLQIQLKLRHTWASL